MKRHALWILALGLLVGCGDEDGTATSHPGKPVVMTTFFPLTWVVKAIGGDAVDVRCPVPPDADPGHWMPPDDVVAAYQAADLVVINGAGFERWLAKVTLASSRLLDTTAALEEPLLRYQEALTHSHGPAGAHVHAGIDGHTWLDPVLLRSQAARVHEALTALVGRRPQALAMEDRYGHLLAALGDLDGRLREVAQAYDGPALYANHPAYNYLARRYGLRVVNLDLDPVLVPSDEALARMRATLRDEPGRVLLWESEPTEAVARRVREALGLQSVVFSPCESPEAAVDGDFVRTMKKNIERLAEALILGR